jgi:hypothetical protein
MMVNDPLTIYATVIGVKLYNSLFNIFVAFGLVFLPLIFVFFKGIEIFFEAKAAGDVTSVSIKKVGSAILLAYVFPLMLFVAPTYPLDVTGITYKPVCLPNAKESKFGDTGTTYDNAFEHLEYGDIHVPIGMALILTGASGITNAAIVSLPCKTDVQAIQNTIDTTHLTPDLSQEVSRFRDECYAKARSQFDNQHPDPNSYKNTMDDYGGETDLSWIGSHVFQQNYYSDLYPNRPVPGFSYAAYPNQYQDFNSKAGVDTPEWGSPDCATWWSDPQNGLQTRLVNLIQDHQPNNSHLGDISVTAEMETWLAKVKSYTPLGSNVTAEDVMTHSLLYDKGSEGGFGRLYTGSMDNSLYTGGGESRNWPTSIATAGLANAGQSVEAIFNTVKRAEIEQEIPILQAVLMALCLALGPMILILGAYRMHVIFSYYFILASIILVTFIEKLIHYLELSLHDSMSYSVYSLGNNAMLYNVFTNLYMYAPMIYLSLMSICGVQAGSALRDYFAQNENSGSGARLAQKGASAAVAAL